MLRHLFYTSLILLSTTHCLLHGVVCAADNDEQSNNSITLFSVKLPDRQADDSLYSPFSFTEDSGGTESLIKNKKEANNFHFSFIFTTDDVMVAATTMIYGNQYTKTSEIVERHIYFDRKKDDWGMDVVKDTNSWSNEVSISNNNNNPEDKTHAEGLFIVKDNKNFETSLAVGKENKTYLFAISSNYTNERADVSTAGIDWSFDLFVGDVKPEKEQKATQQSKTIIEWKKDDDASKKITDEFKRRFANILPYLTFAFLTNDSKIVFVVEMVTDEKTKNSFSVFIQLSFSDKDIHVELLSAENTEDCNLLYFFPWKRKFVTFMVCKDGSKSGAYETADMGKTWQKVERSAFGVLRFLERFGAYKSVTINNKSALLFIKNIMEDLRDNPLYRSFLWMTDGSRAYNVGLLAYDNKYIDSRSLLYTDNELFVLHERWAKDYKNKDLILTRSKELVGETALILDTWANVSDLVLKLCNNMIDQPSDICNMQSFTDGLVGFLFNTSNIDNKQWKDEYLYANATVSNGIKVKNGFRFKGKGAGATWPMSKQRMEEQPYNFTDPGFTLVATVTVDYVSHEKDNSAFGVSYREIFSPAEKRVGLWCTKEGKWKVNSEEKMLFYPGNAKISSETVINGEMCEQGKTYLVALLLNDSKFSVHVNGEKGGRTSQDILINKTTANIMHFYFGVDNFQNDVLQGHLPLGQTQQHNSQQNDEESHVTVRNVLLYNRPFSYDDIKKFKFKKKDEIIQSFGDDGENWTMSGNGNSSSHGLERAVNNTLILNGSTNGDGKKGPMSGSSDNSHGSGGAVNNTLIFQENTNKEIVVYVSVLLSLLLSVFASALI